MTNDIFRLDNTEGYSDAQLAELNRRWNERHADLDPTTIEGKHRARQLLEAMDEEGGAL